MNKFLETFVHKNLDFFRPLQVWSNMSKIHKFRPFPTTVGMKPHAKKLHTRNEQILGTFVHKNLDIFRPLQVWSNMSQNTQI